VNSAPTDSPIPAGAAAHDDPKLRKLRDKLDDNRPLAPAELYRALNDALDEGYELFDLSNREARFALILMGGLNAALVIVASQSGMRERLSPIEQQIEAAIIGVYALLAIAFLFQAITALRPGQFRPRLKQWSRERNDFPHGVRYFEDIVHRNTMDHWDAWQAVTLRQLNAEIAVQVHSLALKNAARKNALRGLYTSLRIMTGVFAAILILFVFFAIR
jgi:hypothetical protein